MREKLPSGKQVADAITYSRLALALVLVGLGLAEGRGGLGLVACLMIADWTADCLDGAFARRSRVRAHTWIGDHDLAVDMAVSVGLLVYLLLAGLVDIRLACAYLVVWALLFRWWGMPPALGMLFQAPIYGWLIVSALILTPPAGGALVTWILAAIVSTWPRFPRQVVPGFLQGLQRLTHRPAR
jgi:cardiolipin synthase